MNPGFKVLFPLFITFVVCIVLIFAANIFFADGRVDYVVMTGASCLFFLMSLVVFRMQYRAMYNSNPNVFIRSVMSGMIIKIFVCLAAVVGYYFLSGKSFNKPAVYFSMVIYMIFLVVEVKSIMKLNKQKNA
jgi:hypothetical protein